MEQQKKKTRNFDSGADVNFMNGQLYAKLWTANGSKIEYANVRNCWLAFK